MLFLQQGAVMQEAGRLWGHAAASGVYWVSSAMKFGFELRHNNGYCV